MFDYLDSVAQAANSQSSAIEAQLGESIEALRDMEKMQPTLGHLDDIANVLQGFFNEAYVKASFDWLLRDKPAQYCFIWHFNAHCFLHPVRNWMLG